MNWASWISGLAAFVLLVLIPGCALSPRDPAVNQASEALLHEQIESVCRVPEARPPLVFIGVAMNSQSTAFECDVQTTQRALETLVGQRVPSIIVSNNPQRKSLKYPFATEATIPRALAAAADVGDENTPVVILLSSHGEYGALALEIANRDYQRVTDSRLAAWLHPLSHRPVVLIISACHSGSLAPALRGSNRAIFYAAAANRASFGCHVRSKNTFFIEELFGRKMEQSDLLVTLMKRAQDRLARREHKSRVVPSLPNYEVGENMLHWVEKPVGQWQTAVPLKHAADSMPPSLLAASPRLAFERVDSLLR